MVKKVVGCRSSENRIIIKKKVIYQVVEAISTSVGVTFLIFFISLDKTVKRQKNSSHPVSKYGAGSGTEAQEINFMIIKTKSYKSKQMVKILYLDFLPVCVQRTDRRDYQIYYSTQGVIIFPFKHINTPCDKTSFSNFQLQTSRF